jgi:hypothetical protein
MAAHCRSPPMIARCGEGRPGMAKPSTRTADGSGIQRHDGTRHGPERGLVDVDGVDLVGSAQPTPQASASRWMRTLSRSPGLGGQQLGVAQAGYRPPRIEDHDADRHRPGQAAAADFVDPGHPRVAEAMEAVLDRARRAGRHGPSG